MKRLYRCETCGEVVTQHKSGGRPVRSGAVDFFGDHESVTMSECGDDGCPRPKWEQPEQK